MRITQGCFSFLPDLTDEQINKQVEYILGKEWAVSLEYTDDPHPRNTYWEMWGNPMFDLRDAKGVMMELDECRKANPGTYIRIQAFDNSRGFETVMMSFIVNRPEVEPTFHMSRIDVDGRSQRYGWEVRR
ncbi:ribulose bisphosphate carboxylase small subunit [Donghicola sp. C2-DW-16]|uniref:Ribulose bisphosphate carboxylase small subunit n=1 Tax=Donghicola mangrovi TaxID=2729614 RepID=A0A850Q3U6_9RHOB|nr:ribulose bisphosphate carboxylase small subunit [Donghicola mangrovi]NVO21758.1 ribulose bisphosphate carboxylase small subunit [Donghicola mangrovi]NVO26653.1 ribulose bisphosphate carboxylase small subunit [Donghicola mangrovi]